MNADTERPAASDISRSFSASSGESRREMVLARLVRSVELGAVIARVLRHTVVEAICITRQIV